MVRFLRPGRIVCAVGVTWLVDESWPVALTLSDGEPEALVSWPWPSDPADPGARSALRSDGLGLVIAVGGQVVWVRRDRCTVVDVEDGLTLAAADPDTAWLIDATVLNPGSPPAPPPALAPGRIVALRRDGSARTVTTAAPVQAIALRGEEVWVTLAELPQARPGLGQGSWWFSYPTSVVQVSRDGLFADGLARGVPAAGDVPRSDAGSPTGWTWLTENPEWTHRYGLLAGGVRWDVGAPSGGDKIHRHVLAVGYDPNTGRQLAGVDLGPGRAQDAQCVGDELWLIVARRRFLAAPRDRGVDVVALSASGEVRTVHSADSVDISRFAPKLRRPQQQQLDAHIDTVRHRFADLDTYWHTPEGVSSPLTSGLTNSAVEVVGRWPDIRVGVTFRHPIRPGLTLRRTLPLYDDTGSAIEHEYAAIHLMEDLDTGHIARADEAIDGVLDT